MPSTLQKLKDSNPLRNMETTDRQMLLVCIGLAFVFWLILNLSQDYDINKVVVVNYAVSPQRALAGDPPSNVPVRIHGRGWNLIWESLRGNDIDITLDIGDKESIQLNRNLLEQEVRRQLSSGDLEIENLNYEPQRIVTTRRDGKRVPVINNVDVRYAPGYASSGGTSLRPDSVTVSGAIDVLAGIESWPSEPLVLDNVEGSLRQTVPLKPPPEGLVLDYNEVTVAVDVEAFIEQQFRVPVTLYNAPRSDSSRVFPAFVTVRATIPQRAFGSVRATDFQVEADLSRMQTDDPHNTVPLRLTRYPEKIKAEFEPRAVEYYIYNRPE
ncbi:YbbR-like domain-containing protein [Lewinella sp. IMCC34183]|uniref:CdaR family protein n=1 Tax=Lewinella sp. IMCC34183 TaxID=2248762 RepID=UPI000E27D860|nr:YbbR-like domain-containing protein [Lewinella sp. IMCC34183]